MERTEPIGAKNKWDWGMSMTMRQGVLSHPRPAAASRALRGVSKEMSAPPPRAKRPKPPHRNGVRVSRQLKQPLEKPWTGRLMDLFLISRSFPFTLILFLTLSWFDG